MGLTDHSIDYSLYLVTDSTLVPESSNFLKQVEDSINSGATIIQLREKSLLTLDFIERAKKVHALTLKKNIPLIINDRVDIALAIDAEGVHVGQDDMPAKLVRKLIGNDKIIGVSCSNKEELDEVIKEGVADYIGLGNIYKTNTKKDVKIPQGMGPIGIRKMLQALCKYNMKNTKKIKCVAIGGINHSNVSKVLYQCDIPGQKLDGVAVVSCIMANENAAQATIDLLKLIKNQVPWISNINTSLPKLSLESRIKKLRSVTPLVHHITNNVVKIFSANVTLAIGASPIMSELSSEFEEFASNIPSISLVINLGTPTIELMETFKHAISVYNKYEKHIIFDPVASGASSARLNCCIDLLNTGQISVIKGNVGEILALWKLTSTYQSLNKDKSLMLGVDSIAKLNEEDIIKIGKEVSIDFKLIVVVTGPVNYVINENQVEKINGGHKLMSYVTGIGCSLGSTIAAFIASEAYGNFLKQFNIFDAVVGAITLYNESGRIAAQEASTPGDFMSKFIDQLYLNTNL